MQGAVLQCMGKLGQKGRTSGLRMAREEWAGRVLEWRHERNRSLMVVKLFSMLCLEVLTILTKKMASSPPLFF